MISLAVPKSSWSANCDPACADLKAIAVSDVIRDLALPQEGSTPLPQLNAPRVQLLDAGQSLVLRLPTLSAAQGQAVIQAVEPVAGPFKDGGQSVDTIGPSLGRPVAAKQLGVVARGVCGDRCLYLLPLRPSLCLVGSSRLGP